jgi:hypothetical protein
MMTRELTLLELIIQPFEIDSSAYSSAICETESRTARANKCTSTRLAQPQINLTNRMIMMMMRTGGEFSQVGDS